MLKGVFVVLATLALARAADLSGEADASASAMDAQLAQLREEVSSLQSANEHLLADAKALGMAAPAPLVTIANTAELDAAASEASAAELDAEIAAAVVDTSATDAEAEADAESGAEDQAVDAQVDIYADGNTAATVSDETNAVDESDAAAPQPSLAEVEAEQKVAALQGEEKAVDAEMAGLEGELQSLMDESDAVLLSNAQSDADEEVAAEEAAAAGESDEESEDESEDSTVEAEEADVAEALDNAFAFRQLVESSAEGEEALQSAEASLPSEDRDDTPLVDAAAEQEAETEELADAVADAEAELTEAADEAESEDESEDEAEAEAEDESEVDEDAEVEAEVDIDAELEMNEQALDESLDADAEAATALVETQTAEAASVNLAALMEQEQSLHAQIEAERVEKADLDRQITQERYISAEAHRELAARINEINAIISQRTAELGALERQRNEKQAALKKVDEELLAHTGKAEAIKRANNKASRLQSSVVKQIQESIAAAKAAAQQKNTAQAEASAASTDAEKARVELAALRQQMATAQRTLFRSRLSHSFGLAEPPKPPKLRKPQPKYGMYLREGEESGAEDSGQAFWRRVVARRTGKGFYEPYYERTFPAKKKGKKNTKKVCVTGKDGKKTCRRVMKPKKQYVRPEWAPEPPKKCKKGFLGKLCRLKKKLAKLTVDMSVVPEFVPEKHVAVEYRDRVPKRDAQVADLLRRIQLAEKALSMYGLHAATASQRPTGARFQQIHDEAEAEEASEDESEEEAEEESEEESEDESESEEEESESEEEEAEAEDETEEASEDEAEAESEDESEAEAESEESSEAEEETAADAEAMRFVQSLVTANAEMQARLQAAADATANTEAVTATEQHTEAAAETQAVAAAETESHADAEAEAEAHAVAEAEAAVAAKAQAQGAVEAEAVQSLAATKRWGPDAVEAQELTALDKLIAKMQNLHHKQSTRAMTKACVKGDAACLKKAQEADAEKLKKKMAKFTLKPTIVDIRRKLLLKRLALLRKIKKAQKKANPEFVTPAYTPGSAADFVKPEYAGEKNKKIHLGLPSGWVIPKRLNKRN